MIPSRRPDHKIEYFHDVNGKSDVVEKAEKIKISVGEKLEPGLFSPQNLRS